MDLRSLFRQGLSYYEYLIGTQQNVAIIENENGEVIADHYIPEAGDNDADEEMDPIPHNNHPDFNYDWYAVCGLGTDDNLDDSDN